MKSLLLAFILLFTISVSSQETSETNTDKIYNQALEEYKTGNFESSLVLTNRGLELAPEYHDIRILQIRNYWAVQNFVAADKDLDFLLRNAPEYVDVKPLVYQRINQFTTEKAALDFIKTVEVFYPRDPGLKIKKAQLLLNVGSRKEARALALELYDTPGVTGGDRYLLQTILKQSISDEVGINYQYIGFSEEYSRTDPWHTISAEYQHNFGRTAVIGRVNYSDRQYDDGILYELESYPVFNDKFYAFANVGFSNGSIFPDVRSSLSFFYNFGKIFEAEAGGRMLFLNENSYFTGIAGLTMYSGKFYINVRTFLGPERAGQLDQNYQGNLRYYFKNADNYLFLRIGNGISPDERVLSTQVIQNPGLEVYYGTFGINKSIGIHHIFQISGGVLYEDITNDRKGTQLFANAGYRYRF